MKNKLTVAGIIVEYNPLHNGHIHHIQKTRELTQCDVLIAVMSPNFVQRGEPAIVSKRIRTQYALEYGVDCVVELPTHLTLQSAETFARSAIALLDMMGVSWIVYGAESLQAPKLTPFNSQLLKSGYSYAKIKNQNNYQANQILGAYYEDEAQKRNIKTSRILRTNSYTSLDMSSSMSSASAIRNALKNNIDIAHTTPMKLNQEDMHSLEYGFDYLKYQIITEQDKLSHYLLVDEGIENLFIRLIKEVNNYNDLIIRATSKRYTASRIRRTLMHILLKTPRTMPPLRQCRILGFNQSGKNYLNIHKKQSSVLVSDFKQYQFKDYEEKATYVYSLFAKKKDTSNLIENVPPVII